MNSAELRELRNQLQAHAQRARIWIGNNPTAPIGAALDSFAHWADRAAAALERLEALERFLDREGIRRGPIDHGMPTPTIVDRVEAYGYECAIRAIRATAAPAPQQGGEQ